MSSSKKRSLVWATFEKTSLTQVKCKLCGISLAFSGSSTGAMLNHIKGLHPTTLKVSEQMLEQPQVTSFFKPKSTPDRSEKISELIADWIASDMLPIRIVDSEKFKTLMQYIEPTYQVPCRKSITGRINCMFDLEKEKLKTELTKVDTVAITTDSWSSRATESFLTVNVQYIDLDWRLTVATLSTVHLREKHTAVNLAVELQGISDEWGLTEKISTCVNDNAANMTAAGRLSDEWEEWRCSAHTLQLAVNAALKVARITKVIVSASKLVGHFRRSTTATAALRDKQVELDVAQHKLIQSVATRWNSTYNMMTRLIEQRLAINAVLSDRSITRLQDDRDLRIKDEDWKLMAEVSAVLEPFETATVMLSDTKKPTLSCVYPIVFKLLKDLEKSQTNGSAAIRQMTSTLRDEIQARFATSEVDTPTSFAVIATILDPRHKHLKFANDDFRHAANEKMNQLLSAIGPVSAPKRRIEVIESSQLISFFGSAYSMPVTPMEKDDDIEWKSYMELLPISIAENPMQWWKNNEGHFPRLAKLAKKYLAIPATSVASERTFSTSGIVVSPLRCLLKPETVSMLTFLAQNKKFRWNDGKVRAFTPETGKLMFTIHDAHPRGVTAVQVTSDCQRIISGGGEGNIRIWDLVCNLQKLKTTMREHRGPITSIAMRKNNEECISASTDGSCIIWDLRRFVRNQVVFANTMFLDVIYHPDECQILTCGADRKVAFWETFDGQPVREIQASTCGPVNSVDISHDGKVFVTGGNDKLVKMWRYISAEKSHVGGPHPGDVNTVKISPDCQFIISGSEDGSIFVWKFPA